MSEESFKQIALRVKELREILEIPVEEMAKVLDVTVEQYAEYESSGMDIPISTLYRMASRFGVDVTVLLTGKRPKMDSYSLVRAGEGVEVNRYAGYHYQNLAFNFKNRFMNPMIVTVEPTESFPRAVSHGGQEFNYCLEGSMQISIGAKILTLNVGDSLYFDAGLPHAQKGNGVTSRFLTIIMN